VTRDDAAEKLKAFIANYAKAADNVDGMINAIEDSIRRFAKGRSNPEVRDQAKMLAEKAKLYRKAIERSEFVWPWLLSGKAGASTWIHTLSEVEKVEKAALSVTGRLKTGMRRPDELRAALGYELAEYFKVITGRGATPSNSADFERNKPGTKFGHFVNLALFASAHSSTPKIKKIRASISSFVFDAAKSGKGRTLMLPKPLSGQKRTVPMEFPEAVELAKSALEKHGLLMTSGEQDALKSRATEGKGNRRGTSHRIAKRED
jgi:hypothetical protein